MFDDILAERLPMLSKHCKENHFDIQVISFPMFLSLFVGFQSMEGILRILDFLFYRGVVTLFQFGLAVFASLEERILKETDHVAVIGLVKSVRTTGKELDAFVGLALDRFSLEPKKIEELYTFHKCKFVKEFASSKQPPKFN
jgi:hypothetical protein